MKGCGTGGAENFPGPQGANSVAQAKVGGVAEAAAGRRVMGGLGKLRGVFRRHRLFFVVGSGKSSGRGNFSREMNVGWR